ncbi:MAG: transcriptional regulator, GntR family with sensor domain [Chloroflexi bacterium]|nr:transcriptional regulator, GntR family with sensor domain [Chloroflexota bacterium]
MKRWETVHEGLLGDIRAGTLRSGDRLPSDFALAGRFGVNRHTVRLAINALESDGLLRVQMGVGTFVADAFLSHVLTGDPRFSDSPTARNRLVRREILAINEVAANEVVAQSLEIYPYDLLTEIRTLSFVDEWPLAVATAYYPVARVPGLGAAFEGLNSPTAALKRCGIATYKRRWTRIGARRPTQQEAEWLRISRSSPVLYDINLDVNAKDEPIKYGCNATRGDRFEFMINADD